MFFCQISVALILILAINLYRVLRAYVWLADAVGPAAYLANLSRWDFVAHNVLSTFTTWVGDCLVVGQSKLATATTHLPLVDLPMLHCMGQQPCNCHAAHCLEHHEH
jgi:hypothetical protein